MGGWFILLAWFGSTCPLRENPDCKSIHEFFWLIIFFVSYDETFLPWCGRVSSRMIRPVHRLTEWYAEFQYNVNPVLWHSLSADLTPVRLIRSDKIKSALHHHDQNTNWAKNVCLTHGVLKPLLACSMFGLSFTLWLMYCICSNILQGRRVVR